MSWPLGLAVAASISPVRFAHSSLRLCFFGDGHDSEAVLQNAVARHSMPRDAQLGSPSAPPVGSPITYFFGSWRLLAFVRLSALA